MGTGTMWPWQASLKPNAKAKVGVIVAAVVLISSWLIAYPFTYGGNGDVSLSLELESAVVEWKPGASFNATLHLKNVGLNVVRIVPLSIGFGPELFFPNGSAVAPVGDFGGQWVLYWYDLVELQPGQSQSYLFSYRFEEWRLPVSGEYQVRASYGPGEVSAPAPPHWQGVLRSNAIAISIDVV